MTDTDKTAAARADAFELGMHAALKEAGCPSAEQAEHFFKIAAELSSCKSRDEAKAKLKALKGK